MFTLLHSIIHRMQSNIQSTLPDQHYIVLRLSLVPLMPAICHLLQPMTSLPGGLMFNFFFFFLLKSSSASYPSFCYLPRTKKFIAFFSVIFAPFHFLLSEPYFRLHYFIISIFVSIHCYLFYILFHFDHLLN